LDTQLVNIVDGKDKAFVWNREGLNAYKKNNESYSANEYVRFNSNGIVGKNGQTENFALTSEGLDLSKGTISIENENGTCGVVIDPLNIKDSDKVFLIKSDGKSVISIDKNGNGSFAGDISAATGTFGGNLEAGNFKVATDGVDFNEKFKVDINGNITANGGTFNGITATGNITAKSISTDNFEVDEQGKATASDISISGGNI
jgi:hypothetical protein